MKRIVVLSLAAWMGACGAEEGGVLQVLYSPVPENNCSYSAQQRTYVPTGFYDPHGYGSVFPTNFSLALTLRNNMAAGVTTDPVTPRNGVELLGFELCWKRAAEHEEIDSFDGKLPFTCEDLPPSQQAFSTTSGTISAGGDMVASVDVLSLTALQALYGDGFYPHLIAEIAQDPSLNVSGAVFSLPLATSPGSLNADPNWGDFPSTLTRQDRVLVLLRAVGKTQAGRMVRSNWYLYPVDICVGCLASACGGVAVATCTGGSLVYQAYQGAIVSFAESCNPFQALELECTEIGCED